MTEDELDLLLTDVREQIAIDIDDERASVAPDFASMMAAAHEYDAAQVPFAWVEEADELAPVVDLRSRPSELAMLADDQLDALIDEAKLAAESDVANRRLRAIPAFSLAQAPRTNTGARRWVPRLALAAAIVGLALALPRLFDRFVDAARGEAANKNQAEFQDHQRERLNDAERRSPRMESVEPAPSHAERRAPEHQAKPANTEAPEHRAPRAEAPQAEAPQAEPTSKRSLAERVAALDDEAQRRWAAGELEAAEEAFRAIIKLAGLSRHADLAYGDLFTLTHQRRDAAAELALWSEYVRRFPDGRFADDARAGLCRRGPTDEREACWLTYLAEFPDGAHRRTAERAVSPTPESSP